MKTLLAMLFGAFLGWTSAVIYFVGQEERYTARIEAERKEKIKAINEAEHQRARALSRDGELDRLRREVMKRGMEWWKLPTDNVERIPPQNFPTTPKE